MPLKCTKSIPVPLKQAILLGTVPRDLRGPNLQPAAHQNSQAASEVPFGVGTVQLLNLGPISCHRWLVLPPDPMHSRDTEA